MEDETPVRILDKKPDDLTVGDALKINAVILAAIVAIPVAISGVIVGTDKAVQKFKEMRKNRKNKKTES